MKKWKLLKSGISFAMALCAAVFTAPAEMITVQAEYKTYDNIYPMACPAGQFEVASLNNSGGFDRQLCTSNWDEARQKMYSLGDAGVIRHSSSGSVTKIINMVNGVVYSYPQRTGTNIATINQFAGSVANMKQTYVTVHREMRWKGLETWSGNGNGKVHIMLNGFDGYIDLVNVDLVPMKAVTDDIAMYLGGNDATSFQEEPFLTRPRQAYYRVEKNGSYTDLVYHCFTGWSLNGTPPQEWTFAIGPAPEWMKNGDVYFSDDGTTFYTDRYYSNQAGIYYPYYQFLPLRTKTGIKASTLDSFLNERIGDQTSAMRAKGEAFVNAGNAYGMNALLVYAIGILESGNGTSEYALKRNNLFGIAAYDTNPDAAYTFPSVERCIEEEMGIFLRGYLDINDFRFFGGQLGNKGSGINVKYAGDPYWGMKIAAIAYGIDKKDNNYDGNLTDFNTSSLGVIKDDARVNILKSAGGDVLYNSAYGATYQKNHMVTVLSETGGFYRIQSTSYLAGGSVRNVSKEGLIPYNWEDAGYLAKAQVSTVNSTAIRPDGDKPTGDFVLEASGSITEEGMLALTGRAYRPGIYVTDENTLTHTLALQDVSFRTVSSAPLATKAENDTASFSGSIDLTKLENGMYFLNLSSVYGKLTDYSEPDRLLRFPEESSRTLAGRVYRIENKADYSVLSVSDVSCGNGASYSSETNACVCDPGYENYTEGKGCTVKPAEEGLELYQMVDKVSYIDETTLQITGYAFFRGTNAAKDGDIEHKLVLADQNSGEEIVADAVTSSLEVPMSLADGFDYSKILYTGTIDLKTLKAGDYALKVRVRNGENVSDTLLISNRIEDQKEKMIDGYKVRIAARAMANYRLEITKEKNDIDFSVISKPTRRNSVYAENSIELKDNILSIDATAFLYNISITLKDQPGYTLILVDETGKTRSYPAEAYESETDPAKLLDLDCVLTGANFRFRQDLNDLPVGRYRLYLDVSVGKNRDIFEVYNIRRKDSLRSEVSEKEISLQAEAVHSRYVIAVTDKSTAH